MFSKELKKFSSCLPHISVEFLALFFFFDVALLRASSPERGGGEEPGGLAVVVHVADGADGVRDLKENFTQN